MTPVKPRKMGPAMQAAVIRGLLATVAECHEDIAEAEGNRAMAEQRMRDAQVALANTRKGNY